MKTLRRLCRAALKCSVHGGDLETLYSGASGSLNMFIKDALPTASKKMDGELSLQLWLEGAPSFNKLFINVLKGKYEKMATEKEATYP